MVTFITKVQIKPVGYMLVYPCNKCARVLRGATNVVDSSF